MDGDQIRLDYTMFVKKIMIDAAMKGGSTSSKVCPKVEKNNR
jgi:hypothetical protein